MLALLATSMLINELLGGNVTAMMNDENSWQNKDSFWLLTLIKDLLQSAENPQGLTYLYGQAKMNFSEENYQRRRYTFCNVDVRF